MKKIIFFIVLMSGLLSFGQEYQIEIRLVDENIGYPTGDPIPGYDAVSNDSGLNDIFETYQATAYYPGYNYIPQWDNRTHFILCDGCDINAFEQALTDYSSVVENTIQCEPYRMNALYVKLITLNNGTNTGTTTPDGVVITDNAELNVIFEDFGVLYYEQSFPSIPSLERVFTTACDCNASELKLILELETDTIELVDGPLGYAILDVEENQKLDFSFYPNPFDDTIIINSSEDIASFELVNMLGQSMFKVATEEQLNFHTSSVSQGNYFLRVITTSGATDTFRLVKK
jgi:hypothetical protein